MIYLIDVEINKLFSFENQDQAINFSENYVSPENLISPEVYYFDGAGTNGLYSRICYGRDGNFSIWVLDKEVTNNEAEYKALIGCLESANKHSVLIGDSKLIINQVDNIYRVKADNLKNLKKRAEYLKISKDCHLVWMRREYNKAGIHLENNK